MARTMTVWEPIRDFVTLRDAMDRLFEDSFVRAPRRSGNGRGGSHFMPPADAWESDDELVIEMALPGVAPDGVDVTFEKDSVVVSGEYTPLDEERNWVLRERAHGSFRRRYGLNVPVDVDKAEAEVRDGVLVLSLPKSEDVKPRKITVKTA